MLRSILWSTGFFKDYGSNRFGFVREIAGREVEQNPLFGSCYCVVAKMAG
jgi:hypothetical protein